MKVDSDVSNKMTRKYFIGWFRPIESVNVQKLIWYINRDHTNANTQSESKTLTVGDEVGQMIGRTYKGNVIWYIRTNYKDCFARDQCTLHSLSPSHTLSLDGRHTQQRDANKRFSNDSPTCRFELIMNGLVSRFEFGLEKLWQGIIVRALDISVFGIYATVWKSNY